MPPETIEITDDLPARVGGYATLTFLSQCGWRFAVVPGLAGQVLVLGLRDLPFRDQIEIRAQAATVDSAAPEIWRQARELGMDFPTSKKRRAA